MDILLGLYLELCYADLNHSIFFFYFLTFPHSSFSMLSPHCSTMTEDFEGEEKQKVKTVQIFHGISAEVK